MVVKKTTIYPLLRTRGLPSFLKTKAIRFYNFSKSCPPHSRKRLSQLLEDSRLLITLGFATHFKLLIQMNFQESILEESTSSGSITFSKALARILERTWWAWVAPQNSTGPRDKIFWSTSQTLCLRLHICSRQAKSNRFGTQNWPQSLWLKSLTHLFVRDTTSQGCHRSSWMVYRKTRNVCWTLISITLTVKN